MYLGYKYQLSTTTIKDYDNGEISFISEQSGNAVI